MVKSQQNRRSKRKQKGRRLAALALTGALLIPNASAAIKEIVVWGSRSINDLGKSDYRVNMETVKNNFNPFVQTDGLREYFHTDQPEPAKADLTEAVSWLIDNDLLSRDESIKVETTNSSGLPSVSISKSDMNELLLNDVTRSDAIMYIYRAVFGNLPGRTIAIETQNVRTYNSVQMTLDEMIRQNTKVPAEDEDNVPGGKVSEKDGKPGHSGTSGDFYGGRPGGYGGDGGIGKAEQNNQNDATVWRYTPQGDEYSSIFGDTNIFISNNKFNQDATGGAGGDGGSGGSATDQGAGGHGGTGGTGGNSSATINYETDYKQVYFKPGADLLFYNTADVAEMYIKAAMSKGILNDEANLRTKKFTETFDLLAKDGKQVAPWDGQSAPYVVNQSKVTLVKPSAVAYAPLKDVLGVNYNVEYSGNQLNIARLNLMNNTSGYFSTELFYKMDAYRYIYRFVYAKEKKISDLERDIINYKYGMQLDGIATKEDVDVIKYLTAKGILNFDSTADYTGLYQPLGWDTFATILYRVAKSDARLDFSKIQLTDSEKQWQAKGYYPQTMKVMPANTIGKMVFIPSEAPDIHAQEVPDGGYENIADEDTPAPDGGSTLSEGSSSPSVMNSAKEVERFGAYVGGASRRQGAESSVTTTGSTKAIQYNAPANEATEFGGTNKYTSTLGNLAIGGLRYTLTGATYSDNPSDANFIGRRFDKLLADITALSVESTTGANAKLLKASYTEEYDPNNFIHKFIDTTINNVFALSILKAKPELARDILTKLRTYKVTNQQDMYNGQPKKEAIARLYSMLDKKLSGASAVYSIKFTLRLDSPQGSTGTPTYEVWNTPVPPAGSKLSVGSPSAMLSTLVKHLESIELKLHSSAGEGKVDRYITKVNMGNMVHLNSADSAMIATAADKMPVTTENNVAPGGDVISAGAQLGSNAAQTGTAGVAGVLTQYIEPTGENAFISWKSIETYNAGCKDMSMQLPIVKISDMLLYNTQTNTYAYFSDKPSKRIALVGTAVVAGDSDLGVAFKSGEGEAAEFFYHVNAIRLLMGSQQEVAVIAGVRCISLADVNTQRAQTVATVESESGYAKNSVIGFQAMLSSQDKKDSEAIAKTSAYHQGTKIGDTRWANFISLSQANRLMNIVSRRIVYSTGTAQNAAYAVVVFNPIAQDSLDAPIVTSSTSLQDLLDAPARPPDSNAGKLQWAKNKELCNAYANWVYGTSGYTYIESGYLLPTAYLYIQDYNGSNGLPAKAFAPLTEEQQKAISQINLANVTTGAVAKLGETLDATKAAGATTNDTMKASYYLSTDYRAIVSGDRVYLNSIVFPQLTGLKVKDGYRFKLNNASLQRAPFILGSTFTMGGVKEGKLANGTQAPEVLVTSTSADGRITCQVGPIIGVPVIYGNARMVLDLSKDTLPNVRLDAHDFTNNPEIDRLQYVKSQMLSPYPNVKIEHIIETPTLSLASKERAYVFNNSGLVIYTEGKEKPIKTIAVPISKGDSTLSAIRDSLNEQTRKYSYKSTDYAETYLQISFDAYKFTVENGMLKNGNVKASEYISPSAFSSLNDLIIDQMIDESNGAIPLNDVPAGSLIEIGTGYYAASGSSAQDKCFVGYAFLDGSTSGIYMPKIQDAAKSFATHFIRGGNQYINISHFFNTFEVLKEAKASQKAALSTVAKETMILDGAAKYSVSSNGKVETIIDAKLGSTGTGAASKYAPVVLSFKPGLLAFKVSAPNAKVPMYEIIGNTKNAIAGPFDKLPFFTDNLLDASLFDQTTNLLSAGFAFYDGASAVRLALERNFQKAFAGDLFTLCRLILFIVLVWLVVASWICYASNLSGIMPILDAFRYPTANRTGKGFDVLKIVSLGTISMDTEFKLGRFIQYNLILAALLCVVWFTGNIALPL